MNETIPDYSPAPQSVLQLLRDLRRALLRLHAVLLDGVRTAYERLHGRMSGGEMLHLVIHDEQFAWLHRISELVVQIDETLDSDEPVTSGTAHELMARSRALLVPSAAGDTFEKNYYNALQH